MNRLGLVVDLGGTSVFSALDALLASKASVLASNVFAGAKCSGDRAVGDAVLAKLVGTLVFHYLSY